MCGIAGAVDLRGSRTFPTERLLAMAGAIIHRGPDDESTHQEAGVALAARRLSIVDLAAGRQPLSNETGDVWVAFNGELFEYPELREELLARGHRLATRCDTEAWVHLYEDFGDQMFLRTRGQFAVSLWDRKTRTLYLGRDRVGICPLHYVEHDGWLLFGSEIKSLLASGLIDARPDVKGIDHFFTFFCSSTTRTCFEGVKSIPPGHYLKIRDGRIELVRYWDLDFPDAGDERRMENPAPLVDEFEQLLRQSIKRRLRGDVPVVSYISGGLDSTVVLGLSSQERGQPLPSFTIGLDNAGPDERTKSAESAAMIGSPLTTVGMNRDQIALAYPELVQAAESPVLDTSCACMMRLAAAVHEQGYKVALTGEGADEALAGYVWFKMHARRERFMRRFGTGLPRLVRSLILASIGGGKAHRVPGLPMGGVRMAQQDVYQILGQGRELLYSPEMWKRIGGHSPYDDLDLKNDRIKRWHILNQSLYAGYKIMLPGLLMAAKGDRIAMNSSVETRYPFLDEDVIQFCWRIDPGYKLHGKIDKWLLRQVAAKVLPPAIANREKTMFRATWAKTFLGPTRPAWVDQLLSPESLRATGLFDPAMIARYREVPITKRCITPRRLALDMGLTMVVSTQLWHHIYCGGGLADLPTWTPDSTPAAFSAKHAVALT